MKTQKGFTVFELLLTIVWFAGIYGWIANLVKIMNSSWDILTTELFFRGLGTVFFPIGAVMGFV